MNLTWNRIEPGWWELLEDGSVICNVLKARWGWRIYWRGKYFSKNKAIYYGRFAQIKFHVMRKVRKAKR